MRLEAAKVLLLNADYTPLGVISGKKAVKLMAKGKVEIVTATKVVIFNMERTVKFLLPKILRLIKFIRALWKSKVPFNKRHILLRDDYTCAYCGKRATSHMSIDHILPKAKGGKSTFENVVTSCVPCNQKKDNRTPSQAGMFPKYRAYEPTIMEFIKMQIKRLGLEDALKELGW